MRKRSVLYVQPHTYTRIHKTFEIIFVANAIDAEIKKYGVYTAGFSHIMLIKYKVRKSNFRCGGDRPIDGNT